MTRTACADLVSLRLQAVIDAIARMVLALAVQRSGLPYLSATIIAIRLAPRPDVLGLELFVMFIDIATFA